MMKPTMMVATHYKETAKLGRSANSDVVTATIKNSESAEPLLVKIKQFKPVKFFDCDAIVLDPSISDKDLLESIPREQVQRVRELFFDSGDRLAKLKHKNLTSVLGVYLPDDSINFGVVMEYFKGETLHKLLKTEEGREILGKIPIKTRLLWIRQIADALHFLHQNGLLHHNLHHSNLVIDLDTMTVKITDFFSECFMRPVENNPPAEEEDEDEEEDAEEEEEEEKETEEDRKLALSKLSDFESPPEMLMGVEFTEASDVFCFTMLLWQILSCEIPFTEIKDKQGLQIKMVKEHLRPSLDKIMSCLPSNKDATTVFLESIRQGWTFIPSRRTTLEEYIQSIDTLVQEL